LLDRIQEHFIAEVSRNRGISSEKVREFATGMIYTGEQAKEIGLVDLLGNKMTAEGIIKKETGLEEIEFAEYKTREPLFGGIGRFFSSQAAIIGKSIARNLWPASTITAIT
jgi:ClpP class serine protease